MVWTSTPLGWGIQWDLALSQRALPILIQNTQSSCIERICEINSWWQTNNKFCWTNTSRLYRCRCNKTSWIIKWSSIKKWGATIPTKRVTHSAARKKVWIHETRKSCWRETKALVYSKTTLTLLMLALMPSQRNLSRIYPDTSPIRWETNQEALCPSKIHDLHLTDKKCISRTKRATAMYLASKMLCLRRNKTSARREGPSSCCPVFRSNALSTTRANNTSAEYHVSFSLTDCHFTLFLKLN